MQTLLKIISVLVLLSGCGGEDPRYRDTRMLERPPILPKNKQANEPLLEPDESVIPKKRVEKGLGDDVVMTYVEPPYLTIKQPFEAAWYSVALALKQGDLKTTDQVRDKGIFYVAYNLTSLFGLFKESKGVIYTLTLEPNGQETKVTTQKANNNEQANSLPSDGYDADADDEANDLLQDVFEILRDDLVDE